MDIRKFFGSASSSKKPNQASKVQDKGTKNSSKAEEKKEKDVVKESKSKGNKSLEKKGVHNKNSSSPSKKLTVTKKLQVEADDSIIVEDFSDEEVIKSSLDSKENGHKLKSKPERGNTASESNKPEDSKSKKQLSSSARNSQDKNRNEKAFNLDTEEAIEVESIHSSGSSTSKSKKDTETPKLQKKSSKLHTNKTSEKSGSEKKEERKDTPVRTSPRKQISTSQEENKPRKRILSDEEDEQDNKTTKPKKYTFDSEDSDGEEVIATRRNRNGKAKGKLSKKVSRALDSDSDEDPLKDSKPKPKRKKKEITSFVENSDEEEKKVTAMDRFVIHNAKTPQEEKKKNNTPAKETLVSVADFFGDGSASRSSRTTAVAKRKHDDVDEDVKKEESIDLTFDEELHDDEDFIKTLEQIDGPSVKKVKPSDSAEDASGKGSLASKLAGKMKQTPVDSVSSKENRDKSKSPQKSPSGKIEKNGKPSLKKGKAYTMEVIRTKPSTVVVSPGKSKKQEDVTPVKAPLKKINTSAEKPKDDDDDDGFGGPKGIKGFQAFKQRSGPQAIGSKEVPEGEENCLEGLTFVITGVLDSIDRDDAKSLVEKHGGKVTGSVSGRTSYVVVGREPGESKVKKAAQLKVKELDEDGLFDLIRTLPGKVSKYEVQAREQMKKEASLKAEKEKEDQKKAAAAKKLEAFRSEKDTKGPAPETSSHNTSSPRKQKSLFTQIKDASEPSVSPSNTSIAASPVSDAKLLSQSQSPSHKGLDRAGSGAKVGSGDGEPQSLLWVDKHKPTSLKQIIGQQGDKSNARKLLSWLKAWHHNVIVKGLKPSGNFFNKGDGAGCRAALLSGPPGIGKTTTATLVCQDLGFSYVELNASDTRSKRGLREVVAESLDNNTLVDYTGSAGQRSSGGQAGQSHCLIMDEVDGMAGNEDRGGLQELVQLIKKSKIPIICICNDRNSMKMRTLSNYCLDLRFQRPRVEQIKGAMMSLAFKEGLKIPPAALNEIILASNHDIRQVIHNMSVWSVGDKTMTFDQVKSDAQKAQKDIKLGPFDTVRKVFVNDDETRKMSINDKSDLFFNDYSFGPLFVHENYIKVLPNSSGGNHSRHMSCLARAVDSICDGDLVDKLIRREGNWNLLPTQAMFSSVIPGEVMRGNFPHMAEFPQWLGKFSSTNKTHRIIQELSTHMGLEVSCDKRGLSLDYLPAFRSCLTKPLVSQGSEGVSEVIKVMDNYDIVKEDFDNILEVTKWPGGFDPMSQLDTKTKSAFTRQYNKQIHLTPYATGATGGKKRKARGAPMEEEGALLTEDGGEENGGGGQSEEEEDEGIEANTMIKAKKAAASKGKGRGGGSQSRAAESGGKGKGRGKGSKK